MASTPSNPHRQQQLYWHQMVVLYVAVAYMRRYRDNLARWVKWTGVLRAVASSGSIAAWAVWKEHAFAWALVIALSQVLDALKDVFPFVKRHKAASEHTVLLSSMFIDAQLEWEGIFSGRYSEDEIMKRWHKLAKLQHDAESRIFPEGLAKKDNLFSEAQQEAQHYFQTTYELQEEI